MAPMSSQTYSSTLAVNSATPITSSNISALNSAFNGKSGIIPTILQLLVLPPLITFALLTLPLYALTYPIYGRPPINPPLSEISHYLILTIASSKVHIYTRLMVLTNVIFRKILLTPIFGVAWHLDEIFMGSELDKLSINEPVFLISGARSGSTTTGHLLDNDPQFVSPSGIMTVLPFLWLWKLTSYLEELGLTPSRESFQRIIIEKVTNDAPEFVARHEFNPFKPDTFEVPWLCNRGFFQLGPDFGADEMINTLPVSDRRTSEYSEVLWEDFECYTDRIMRKTLKWNRCKKRIMIKGHFIAAAKNFEKKYKNSRFITVLRDPEKRLESLLNFMIANRLLVAEAPLTPTFEQILATGEAMTRLEIDYMREEREFFDNDDDGKARKISIKFDEYVKDTESAIKKCYAVINDDKKVPEEISEAIVRGKEEHKNRSKMAYRIKLSLAEFGVDVTKFRKLINH